MGSREMFLVLGATVLFGVISFSATMTMLSNDQLVWENENRITALAIGQRYIEEAKTRPQFDAIASPMNVPADFTAPGGLGHGAGESYPNFNDIDDYNGFADTVSTSKNTFIVDIDVYYVQDSSPDVAVGFRTCYKKMDVEVSFYSAGDLGKVQTSMVFGYY